MEDNLQLKYTVCFLTRGPEILMLYRNRPPNQGLWNGVGGHIETGEKPSASCLREIQEETGFKLQEIQYGGLLTWSGFEIENGGLFIFTAEAPPGEPAPSDEGMLKWCPREWVFHSPEVVANIHYFLPRVLAGESPQEYFFGYEGGKIVQHQVRLLPACAFHV